MRLVLHTIICCCLFTTVLPLVKGTTEELNSGLKKRFKVWLQSRMKRDLHSSLVPVKDQHTDIRDRPQQDENPKIASIPASNKVNIRPKKSTSPKQTGCVLATCIYHDLLYELFKISKQRDATAPKDKIGSNGYGRRRRSLLEATQLALQTGRQRRSTEAASKVSLAAETEDNS